MKNIMKVSGAVGLSLAVVIAVASSAGNEKKDVSSKTSEASIVTNDNGSVSRSFTECSVTTNGSMVTEHRRETRTTMDSDGNVLTTSTSEYAQSYSVGDDGISSFSALPPKKESGEKPKVDSDSFMGLKFAEKFESDKFVADPSEPSLLRSSFKPKKELAGFDDYYVYVTPVTHKIAKVYACAKNAVDPRNSWRRNYLIEALEKRYRSWARLRSWCRPIYTFDIGSDRHVTACLDDASEDYATIVVAWDDKMLNLAMSETENLKLEASKKAAEKRKSRIDDAASAF